MSAPWPPSQPGPYNPAGAQPGSTYPGAIQALFNIVLALNAQTQEIGKIMVPQLGGAVFGGEVISANFNSTSDQAIALTLPTANWVPQAILVTNPSVSLTTAAGGVYSAAAKAGYAIVSAGQVYTGLTTSAVNTAGSALLLTLNTTAFLNVSTIYLSLTTPQGSAATADVRVFIQPLY